MTGYYSAAEVAASLLKRRQQSISLSTVAENNGQGEISDESGSALQAVNTPLASQRLYFSMSQYWEKKIIFMYV